MMAPLREMTYRQTEKQTDRQSLRQTDIKCPTNKNTNHIDTFTNGHAP